MTLTPQETGKPAEPRAGKPIPQIKSYLADEIDLSECKDRIAAATRQYAKRQRTWFSKENWLTPCPIDPDTVMKDLAEELARKL